MYTHTTVHLQQYCFQDIITNNSVTPNKTCRAVDSSLSLYNFMYLLPLLFRSLAAIKSCHPRARYTYTEFRIWRNGVEVETFGCFDSSQCV